MEKRINVIYFKHIIENALDSFFRDNAKSFVEREDGIFVFSKFYSKNALKNDLRRRIVENLKTYLSPYSPLDIRTYFIIGACYPKDNILLPHIPKEGYFPEKDLKYIREGNIKYFLKVEGVRIDLSTFNCVLDSIFDDFFMRKGFKKYFPENVKNLFFLKSSVLDCRMTYRILKKLYGKTNVCNMYTENRETMKSNLYSVNEKINDYVRGKREMLEKDSFKPILEEMGQYVNNCLSGII